MLCLCHLQLSALGLSVGMLLYLLCDITTLKRGGVREGQAERGTGGGREGWRKENLEDC